MAITFESIPNNYSPSGNPLSYVFSSDQTGQSNFFYKLETLLDGSVVSEDVVYPQADEYSQFDVSPIIDNLIPKPTLTSDIGIEAESIDQISLKVTEVYGSPAVDQATLTSSQTYTFKAELELSEWETKDFATDYVNLKWLTDVPDNNFRVIRGQDVMCSILLAGMVSTTITWYDSSGLVLDTFNSPPAMYTLLQLNLSSSNMTLLYGGGSYDDVAYFIITIGMSEQLTITYVDDYCNGIHALVWLNKYGTFDQYPIEHNVSQKSEIESRSYKKRYGQWSGTDFEYDHTSSGNLDFEKIIDDKGMLVTNYMTDTIQNWFVSVYDSVQHYLYDPTGLLFRCNLSNRGYKNKQGRFEDLISEELNYSKTNNRKSIKL